ncbi:hypothetical protein L1987_64872 [Smallanthus sonchifolius]|uniref:Uncharacterized protein n=1 Tax=Smallanthus sonchifolius TaxID=185202 RepID=A0ACB9BSY5_9ASTR|nr:hypothetical protein L1987_64872 [Smallanthus sonchifolius]
MSTARSHENSANNDTEEPSEHSSNSRSTSVSRSLNIRLNAELPIAAPAAGLRLPPESWERDYLSMEGVHQLHDQGFEHEMRLHHYQNLMDQVSSKLTATHTELHRARDLIEEAVWEIQRLRMKVVIWGLIACMASSSDSSADESDYVTAKPPCPRAANVTGPDPTRTIDLNIPDHPHEHVLGKCLMWLPAESSAQLDFHTDLATDMSGHMNELEQDIMQNQERTTTAIRDARTARIQSRVAIAKMPPRRNVRNANNNTGNGSDDLTQIVSQQLLNALPTQVEQIKDALKNDTENIERNSGTNGGHNEEKEH